MLKKISFCLLFLITSSCFFSTLTIKNEDQIILREVDFNQVPNWQNDNHQEALKSFIKSCEIIKKIPEDKNIGKAIGHITPSDFDDVCQIAEVIKNLDQAQAQNFFENWFRAFEVYDENNLNKGQFTGYYIPFLNGSKQKTIRYRYPIYQKPEDKNLQKNATRAEVEEGALKNKNLEIIYVDDKIDLFFMHIQGSGKIRLVNGDIITLAFDGKNKFPYTSIGKFMIENDIIKGGDNSYHNIKKWLKENPKLADNILNLNSSYIYFKIAENNQIIGGEGSELTAQRSIAIDSKIIPYGLPIWLNIEDKNFHKLLISQDTGSAIKGAIRGDVFFGEGRVAEMNAATMNNYGKYYILLPASAIDTILKN